MRSPSDLGTPPLRRATARRVWWGLGIGLLLVLGLAVGAGEREERPARESSEPGPPSRGGPTVRPVDGGAGYYAGFAHGLPTAEDYFPVGVWFESVTAPDDLERDREVGINTYVELTASSDLSLAVDAGMSTLVSWGDPQAHGFVVTDEPDMWAGAGAAEWTGRHPGEGDICRPASAACGFTVLDELLEDAPPGVMTYVNYGKGVAFWHTDEAAARFVDVPDVVSVDTYWFTDPNICGESEGGQGPGGGRHLSEDRCRLAANYGWTVERARSLVAPPRSKPVWLFVEVGHPFSESWAPTITGPQIRAAVWSGIIHGARGVVYFNHSFGGDCVSQHVLRDACGDAVRADVSAVNRQVEQLAPTLNAPFVDGVLSTGPTVDAAVKLHDGSFTVIAGSTVDASQEATFVLACGGARTAEVVGEDRSLPVRDGRFADTFADGDAVHIYRLDGDTCGLR